MASTPPSSTGFLSSLEAAARLGYTVQHVRRLIRQGSLVGSKLGRDWLVEETSVDRLLAQRANLSLSLDLDEEGVQ